MCGGAEACGEDFCWIALDTRFNFVSAIKEEMDTYVSRRIRAKVEEKLQEGEADYESHRRKLVELASQDAHYSQQSKKLAS